MDKWFGLAAAICLLLSGCGGGGTQAPPVAAENMTPSLSAVEAPTPTPTPIPTPTPTPTPAPTPTAEELLTQRELEIGQMETYAETIQTSAQELLEMMGNVTLPETIEDFTQTAQDIQQWQAALEELASVDVPQAYQASHDALTETLQILDTYLEQVLQYAESVSTENSDASASPSDSTQAEEQLAMLREHLETLTQGLEDALAQELFLPE